MSEREVGDAQLKLGRPINCYYGTKPICMFCLVTKDRCYFECTKPGRIDTHEYAEPCREIDWLICPMNPNNLIKEFNKANR